MKDNNEMIKSASKIASLVDIYYLKIIAEHDKQAIYKHLAELALEIQEEVMKTSRNTVISTINEIISGKT